jgi:membrane dipeptidase
MGGAATAGLALASPALAMLAGQTSGARVPTGGARRLYERAISIDGLGYLSSFDPGNGPDQPLNPRTIAELRASGITAINFTVGSVGNDAGMFEQSASILAFWTGVVARHPDLLLKVDTFADLERAKRTNRVGVIFGFQDSSMFGNDVGNVKVFRDLGVRIVQPTYNLRNLAGDGCLEPANGGLSRFGHQLVAALNEAKIVVDLSHAGSRTQLDGIAASTAVPIISHSGCRALVDTPRNTGDDVMRALSNKGGVLGIYSMPFLKATGQPHAEDLWRHIEHAVNVMGEDHVGLGTDGGVPAITDLDAYRVHLRESHERRVQAGFAAPGESADVMLIVPEYNSPRRFEMLADDLLRRGHSTARVEKIIGGNFARVFRSVWA